MVLFNRFYIKLLVALLALLATVFIYLPASRGGFVFDDYSEVADRPAIKMSFHDAARKNPFRAIPAITYRLDYLIGGPSARIYHLTNILWHILAALALALFWRKAILWTGSSDKHQAWWMGAICGLAFLFHPLNVESVAYISSRADVIVALFTILALWCIFASLEKAFNPFWHIAGVAAFCASLLTKESAVIVPVLVAVCGLFIVRSRSGSLTRLALLIVPFLLVLLFWISFRFSHRIDFGAASSGGNERGWAMPVWAMGTYTRLALWPLGLRIDHGSGPDSLADLLGGVIIGAGVIVIGATALFYWRRTGARLGALLSFAALWWILALAIIAAAPLADPIAEHRAYFAMGSFSALPAFILLNLKGRRRATATVAILLTIVLWGASSASYVQDWLSPVSLWANAVRRQPSNARAWDGLGSTLLDAGETRFAKRALEIALAINPSLAKPEGDLGIIAMERGDFKMAEIHFREALLKNPSEWRALVNFAVLEEKRGNLTIAEEYLRRAILINAKHSATWFNLGNVLQAMKRYEDAKAAYREALIRNPDHIGARSNLAQVYENMGDLKTAMAELSRVFAQDPGYEPALLAASRIEYKRGDLQSSALYLQRYLKTRGDDKEAWRNLADLLKQLGRNSEAEEAMRKGARE